MGLEKSKRVSLLPVEEAAPYRMKAWGLLREGLKWGPVSVPATVSNEYLNGILSEGHWFFIVVDKKIVGLGGMHKLSAIDGSCEISFVLDPEARGQGVGREGCLLLMQWAAGNTRLRRATAICLGHNHSVGKLLSSNLGFVKEGVLKGARFHKGEFVNVVVYGRVFSEEDRAALLKGA